jgi:hypothetical protein
MSRWICDPKHPSRVGCLDASEFVQFVDPAINAAFAHRISPETEVVQFFDTGFRQIYTRRTSPETKFGERSSDAVQAYARVRAEHGKRRALPSPEFSLNAGIPTLPNCVQEGHFNLANTALEKCTTSSVRGGTL